MASETQLSEKDAQKAVEAALRGIIETLKKGEEVRIKGFGSFSVKQVSERQGRNPRTGETMKIAASNRPIFKAGKELKEAINPA